MKTVSPEKTAEEFLRRHPDVTVVEALQPDMCGVLRGKRVMVRAIRSLLADGIRLPGSTCILDTTGQNIPAVPYGGADGDPDQYCRAVPGRLSHVPWTDRPMAQTLCSLFEANGTPYFADPRHVLARAYAPLRQMGLTAAVAIELEFYLLDPRPDGRGRPRPAAVLDTGRRPDTSQVYGLEELHDFDGFMGDVEAVCAAQSLNAEAAISEYSPGQFEINLHHVADPLDACDQAVLLKRAIKGVARKHGFLASFMAKPFQELTGNGQHVHISLVDEDGRNVFARGRTAGRARRTATPSAACWRAWPRRRRSSAPTPIPTADSCRASSPPLRPTGESTTGRSLSGCRHRGRPTRGSNTGSPAPTPTPTWSRPRCLPASITA